MNSKKIESVESPRLFITRGANVRKSHWMKTISIKLIKKHEYLFKVSHLCKFFANLTIFIVGDFSPIKSPQIF